MAATAVIGACVLVITLSMSDSVEVLPPNPRALEEVTRGSSDFSIALYQALRAKDSGNLIVSPLSVQTILALVYHGAAGATAEQLATGLKFPEDRSQVMHGFRTLLSSLKSDGNITLEVANKVFSQAGFGIKPDFSNIARTHFLSDTQELNFAENTVAAKTINQWVEEKTRNKIKDLITPDMLDALTRLVLVNAVYFKGNWRYKFDAEHTTTQPFYITPTQTKEVQMMHIKKKFRYAEIPQLNAQALELPYEGDQISMLILLPNSKDGLAEMEAKLSNVSLVTDVVNHMYSTEVSVSLPRFKLEKTMDLNPILKALGMVDMFENVADFSGISSKASEPLKVSQVVQKAFIEVNEEGSEAAAATGVLMMTRTVVIPYPPAIFKADHPFFLALLEKNSNTVLFLGVLSSP